jgi:hypothetical protein
VVVLDRTPGSGVLSVAIRLDAPTGTAGWTVLEAGRPWALPAELYWRRRVHAGWNHLVWDELSGLPDGVTLTLRLAGVTGATWAMTEPSVHARIGLAQLAPVRGLLVAAGLAVGLLVVGLLRWTRRPGLPGSLAWMGAVAAVAGVGLWLRLHTLATQSFWFDEVLTAIGSQSLGWALYAPQVFGHPPLQYLAAWVAAGGGTGEGWLRAPFAMAGTMSVVALACVGRQLLGASTGFVAALLLALSPFHVELSQLARPYAFLLLFSLLALLALVRALRRGDVLDWLWFSTLTALNLYTHYLAFPVFLLHVLAAVAWLIPVGGRRWQLALVSFVGAGVLYLPWVSILPRLVAGHVGGGHVPAGRLLDLAVNVLWPQLLGPGVAGAAGTALAVVGLLALRVRPSLALVIVAWILGPLVGIWTFQPEHFVAGRHLAFVMPALMLLVAHGVGSSCAAGAAWLRRWAPLSRRQALRGVVACAVIALLLAWEAPVRAAFGWYYQQRQGADWRTVAEVLDRLVMPGDRVLATLGAAYPLRYYWSTDIVEIDPTSLSAPSRSRGQGHLWVVTLAAWDDGPEIARWLASNTIKVGEVAESWSLPRVFIHRIRSAPRH